MNMRTAAAEAGQTKYNTNKACKRGHLSERYVSNGQCIECLKGSNDQLMLTVRTNTGYKNRMSSRGLVQTTIHIPTQHKTITKVIERLLCAPNADQFITWLHMMDAVPLGYQALAAQTDWRNERVNATMTQRQDDAGTLLYCMFGNWYEADEVLAVLFGDRPHAERVREVL